MRRLGKLLAVVVALVLALGIGIMGASELGGEIVTLHTSSPTGDVETRIWVVDHDGHAWLRAGMPDSGWLLRIDADPDVVVERGGESLYFRAVPVRDDPALRERIHELMREHYTWADRAVSLLRDGSKSVPIRLDPIETEAAG